jgi:hypothetical protein
MRFVGLSVGLIIGISNLPNDKNRSYATRVLPDYLTVYLSRQVSFFFDLISNYLSTKSFFAPLSFILVLRHKRIRLDATASQYISRYLYTSFMMHLASSSFSPDLSLRNGYSYADFNKYRLGFYVRICIAPKQ